MISDFSGTVLIVPGLRDHVEDHWQTWLARQLPNCVTVPPLDTDRLSCAARVERLQETMSAIDGPVVIVAHSAGVMMTVHWAAHHHGPVTAALLVAPADVEQPFPPGYPTTDSLRLNGWLPVPRTRLPFPSVLAASSNDPLCAYGRAVEFAKDWGSELMPLGPAGHVNPASGFGPWPGIGELLRKVTEG